MRSHQLPSGLRPPRTRRGFSLIEILAVLTIVGILAAIVTPAAAKLIRRARDLSAMSSLMRSLDQWRLLSIKRGFNVCVQFSTTGANATDPAFGNAIVLQAWEDRNPDFVRDQYTPPGTSTAVDETDLGCIGKAGQTTANTGAPCLVTLESTLHLGTPSSISPQGKWDDLATSVLFNGYSSGGSTVNGLIVFTPTGGIIAPPANAAPTVAGGRGIYFGDAAQKNWFRVTIPSDLSGRPRQEMYVAGLNPPGYYSASNTWVWQ